MEVGGATETEQEYLKDRAEEAVRVVRLGLQGGVVPGGGAALLACRPALERVQLPDEEQAGVQILADALTAPARALLRNSGYEPEPILARLLEARGGCGFDVIRGQFTDMVAAAILDPLQVVQMALQTAVSGAIMHVTTEVLVHRPRENRDEEVDFRP
ncbi:hypothetical protein RY27_04820 [Litorilinea aerophila]|nr:hypothetical protein RY27_04820 [Litorilinea aerophila]